MADEVAAVHALAMRLAREAGAIQRERYETPLEIGTKSRPIDLVTEVDRACEAHIVATLRRERPGDDILAEEGGAHEDGGAAWRWVIDPLDGTVNFAHGYPCFCVSIGVERHGVRTVGVVYEPLRDELFEAVRGGGARRNDKPIAVSEEARFGRALVATGFAYDVHDAELDNLAQFARVTKRAGGVRRDGSAAIDLCYVACGRFEALLGAEAARLGRRGGDPDRRGSGWPRHRSRGRTAAGVGQRDCREQWSHPRRAAAGAGRDLVVETKGLLTARMPRCSEARRIRLDCEAWRCDAPGPGRALRVGIEPAPSHQLCPRESHHPGGFGPGRCTVACAPNGRTPRDAAPPPDGGDAPG